MYIPGSVQGSHIRRGGTNKGLRGTCLPPVFPAATAPELYNTSNALLKLAKCRTVSDSVFINRSLAFVCLMQ